MIIANPEFSNQIKQVSAITMLWAHLVTKLLKFKLGGMKNSTTFGRCVFNTHSVQNSSDLRIQFYALRHICLIEIAPVEILTVQTLHRFEYQLYFVHKIALITSITLDPQHATVTTYIQNDKHTIPYDMKLRKQNLLLDPRRWNDFTIDFFTVFTLLTTLTAYSKRIS